MRAISAILAACWIAAPAMADEDGLWGDAPDAEFRAELATDARMARRATVMPPPTRP